MRQTPYTYAVTIICGGRERIFLQAHLAAKMIELLDRHRSEGRYKLHGFVLLPDHMHVLLSPALSVESVVGLLKGGFSFALRKQWRGRVWQDGYYSHRVIDRRDYDSQLSYIAANPERWGYQDYPHQHSRHAEMIDPLPDHLGG